MRIRFVGGPADGRTLTIPDDQPPPIYLVPIVPPVSALLASPLESEQLRAAEYEPQLQDGWPCRADDDAYLYVHRAAPVSPEERARLERARRDAQASRERREAELDAAWREIRKERPHFPEDRRDLF